MSVKLLDPTIDIVFKLLLLRRQELLRDMIEAVLNLPLPIQDMEVQNPEIPKDFPGDKSVVLDIRVRLHNGQQIDLEMQSTVPPGTRARFLYIPGSISRLKSSFMYWSYRSSTWRRPTAGLNSIDGLASYGLSQPRKSTS